MSHTKWFSIVKEKTKTNPKDSKLITILGNLECLGSEQPYLISETFNMLDDDSPLYGLIPDINKLALAKMIRAYFNTCWTLYLDVDKYVSLTKYSRLDSYSIDADKGVRLATENEIKQGVRGLQRKDVYPAGEDYNKLINLLVWTMTGNTFYFRRAGFKNNFNSEGKVTDNLYQMITMCCNELNLLFDFVADENKFTKLTRIVEKSKKTGGIKYATYASDEINENISVKQLINNVKLNFPRNSSDKSIRKAIALSLKYTNNKSLTPMEISYIRGVYSYYLNNTDMIKAKDYNKAKENEDTELKKKCDLIVRERYRGIIDSNHFVYKIIDTLRKYNFSKCSNNQYAIIEEALRIINTTAKNNNVDKEKMRENEELSRNAVGVLSDDDLDNYESLSDFIGDGEIEEEHESLKDETLKNENFDNISIDDIIED